MTEVEELSYFLEKFLEEGEIFVFPFKIKQVIRL